MAPISFSLLSFLNSAQGQKLARNVDDVSIKGFDDLKEIGQEIHDFRTSLTEYEAAMSQYGFDNATVRHTGKEFVVTFAPSSGKLKQALSPDQYPTLTIKESGGKYTVSSNGEIAINTGLMMETSDGQQGLVSSLSLALSRGAKALQSNFDSISAKYERGSIDANKFVHNIAASSSMAMTSIKSLDPKYYSQAQRKQYSDDLAKQQKQSIMTADALSMIQQRVRMDLYWQQMYQLYRSKGIYSSDNPRDEQRFTQELEEIMQVSRKYTDMGAFTQYLQKKHPWVLKSIWGGHLENFYSTILGKTSTTGVRENTPGVLGLIDRRPHSKAGDFDIPNSRFVRPGSGWRKVLQGNLIAPHESLYGRTYAKGQHKGELISTAAQGTAKLYTASQRANKNFRNEDLYYAMELTDDDLFQAYKQAREKYQRGALDKTTYQRMQAAALHGFGDAGSIIADSMTGDFRQEAALQSPVDGTVSIKSIEDKIRDKVKSKIIAKKKKENAAITDTDIDKNIDQWINEWYARMEGYAIGGGKVTKKEDKSDFNFYRGLIAKELGKQLQFDSMEKVSRFSVSNKGDIYDIFKIAKRNVAQGVARGGTNFDDRTAYSEVYSMLMASAAVDKFIQAGYTPEQASKMVYNDPKHPEKGLRISIARDEGQEVTEKNLRNLLDGWWEYLLNEGEKKFTSEGMDVSEARQHMLQILNTVNNGRMKGIETLDKNGNWKFNDIAATRRYLNATRKGNKATPLDQLNDLGRAAMAMGVVTLPTEGIAKELGLTTDSDLYQVDSASGKIKAVLPFITAQTRYMTRPDQYEGAGQETASGSKWNQHYVTTIEATIGQMINSGMFGSPTEAEKAVAPMRAHVAEVKEALAERQQEYRKYLDNGEFTAQTFYKDQDRLGEIWDERVKAGTANRLTLSDIEGWDASSALNYIPGDDLTKSGIQLDANDPLLKLMGMVDQKDTYIDLGKAISANVDGKTLRTRYVPLYRGTVKQVGDDGRYMPDNFAMSNRRIFEKIQAWKNAKTATEKDAAEQALVYEIRKSQNENALALTTDMFKDYQSVSKKDYTTGSATAKGSGYMLTLGLNEHASEIFQDILKDNGVKLDDAEAPYAYVSAETGRQTYEAQWKEKEKEIRAKFKAATGLDSEHFEIKDKDGKSKFVKLGKKATIDKLIDAYTVDSGHYQGKTDTDFIALRNPIIKFANDAVNPRVAFLRNTEKDKQGRTIGLGQGAMMIDTYLAKTMKNDMDGDRILMEVALQNGDYATASDAWARYSKKLRENQVDAKNATKKLNSTKTDQDVIDELNQKFTNEQAIKEAESNQFIASKGAGIYGDLTFATNDILRKYGADQGHSLEAGKSKVANIATLIAGTLYQEGINLKNTKMKSGDQDTVDQINSLFQTVRQEYTWDNVEGFRHLIQKGQSLGILGDGSQGNPFFKPNVIGNEGLASLDYKNVDSDRAFLDQMWKIAEEAKQYYSTNYGEDSEEYKGILKDVEIIRAAREDGAKSIANLSGDFWAVVGAGNNGLKGIFSKLAGDKTTFGKNMFDMYEFIESKGTFERKQLNATRAMAESGEFDQETLDKDPRLKRLVEEIKKHDDKEHYVSKLDEINKAKLQTYNNETNGDVVFTSPSALSKKKIIRKPSPHENIQQDLSEYFDALEVLRTADPNSTEYANAVAKIKNTYNLDQKGTRHSIEALSRGTIAHDVANQLRSSKITEQQLMDILNNDKDDYVTTVEKLEAILPDFSKAEAQLIGLLPGEYGTGNETGAKDFFTQSIIRGINNAKYVNQRIAMRNGVAVGNEVGLAGAMNPRDGKVSAVHGYADLIYKIPTNDRNKATWVTGDYKNTSEEPTAANGLQVMSYGDMIMQLNEEIKKERGAGISFDAEGFLHQSDNNIAKIWLAKLENDAKKDVKGLGLDSSSKEYMPAYNKAFAARMKDFQDNIYNGLGIDLQLEHELYVNRGDGFVSTYRANRDNPVLQHLLEKYKTQDYGELLYMIMPDELENLVGSGGFSIVDTGWAGTEDQLKDAMMEQTSALHAIVEEMKGRAQTIAELTALRNAELNEEKPNLEVVDKLDKEIKAQEKALGPTDPETELKKLKKLRKKTKNPEEIAQYDARIAEIELSLTYRQGQESTRIKNGPQGTEAAPYVDYYNAQVNAEHMEAISKEAVDSPKVLEKYGDQLTDYIKKLRELETQLNNAKNSLGSKFITDEQKADTTRVIGILEQQIRDYTSKLNTAASNLFNAKGEFKSAALEQKYGAYKPAVINKDGSYSLSPDEQTKIAAKSKHDFEVSEQQKDLSYFNKAYGVYKQQYDMGNQIWQLQQNIESKKGTADQNKIWQAEIDNLTKQQALMASMTPDIKQKENGYSEETDKKAQQQAQLESEQWRLKQMAKSTNGSGQGGYGGFLGIDSTIMRWVDRMIGGGLLATGIQKIKKSLSDLVTKAKQLDAAMTNLRIVTGETSGNAKEMISTYSELAQQLGVTTTEVTSAATEWLRQGYNVAEVNDLVQSSLYLSKLGMIDSTTATKDLTSAMKGFKLEASEAMDVVDKLTSLDVEAATTAGDIAEGLAEFANLATSSGVDIDQASAYVATIADVTQQSGSSVGTALKTILSRYSNVKATAYNNLNLESSTADSSEDSLNDVEKVLNKMGISMRDTNLEFKDFDEVLDEIADKWATLDNVSKKAIANAFAGRQV